jgi:hypothetical protein
LHRRPITKFGCSLERLEDKHLLGAGALATRIAAIKAERQASAICTINPTTGLPVGFLGFRVTNPSIQVNYKLEPPFQQVLVQPEQPVAGQTYNLLQIAVRNGTGQTFTASNGVTVRLNVNH